MLDVEAFDTHGGVIMHKLGSMHDAQEVVTINIVLHLALLEPKCLTLLSCKQ